MGYVPLSVSSPSFSGKGRGDLFISLSLLSFYGKGNVISLTISSIVRCSFSWGGQLSQQVTVRHSAGGKDTLPVPLTDPMTSERDGEIRFPSTR